MKQFDKNQEKIDNIMEKRAELSLNINSTLKEERSELIDNMSKLNDNSENDTILKAKQIITELSEQIITSSSIEEIVKLRKRINYYINKIKKVLSQRGIDPFKLSFYNYSTKLLRKNIAKNIRYLKREHNLTEINYLHENFNDLTKDDKKKLTRMIRNELSFIKRNNEDSSKKDLSNISFENISLSNEKNILLEDIELSFDNKENEEFENLFEDNAFDSLECNDALRYKSLDNYSIEDYKNSFDRFSKMYKVSNLYEFGTSLPKNIASFFKNIPSYIHNKKRIKNMKNEYQHYYPNYDLYLFIKYMEEKNSIRFAIEDAFRHSVLSKEDIISSDEERSYWIEDELENLYTLKKTY